MRLKDRGLCGGSRPGPLPLVASSSKPEEVDFGAGDREGSLEWRLGARPGLTSFPAPSASGPDSCPPECQGQGGA